MSIRNSVINRLNVAEIIKKSHMKKPYKFNRGDNM